MNCRACGEELPDGADWTLFTSSCPYCGVAGPSVSARTIAEIEAAAAVVRVRALSRQAASELRIFLLTVAAVVGAIWGVAYLVRTIPAWRGRPVTPYTYRSTRRDGPDYYLRNSELRPSGSQPALVLPMGTEPLEAILAYAVNQPEDVSRVYDAAVNPDRAACQYTGLPAFSDAVHRTSGCLIAGVVNIRDMPYSMRLVDFAKSRIRVLQVLRDELGIPPPAGHAVVRIFEPGDPIPEPVNEFHRASPEIAGVSFGGPYIAIFNADSGLDDVMAHELVHAYLSTVLGRAAARLPSWFQEGVALNLSRTPMASTASAGPDFGLSVLTAQYQEYKHVFDRLETRFGRKRYLALIRECVLQRSERPMLSATASQDYAELRRFADAWAFADVRRYLLMLAAGVTIAFGNFVRRRRRLAAAAANCPDCGDEGEQRQ